MAPGLHLQRVGRVLVLRPRGPTHRGRLTHPRPGCRGSWVSRRVAPRDPETFDSPGAGSGIRTQVAHLSQRPESKRWDRRTLWNRREGGDTVELWNTRSRRKETFTAGKTARVYVCGITPYATTHLGHARTYLVFDVLIRELERLGHAVRYVQNVTDVDDPLYARARELGRPSADVAAEFTRTFLRDMAALRVRPPDVMPRVSREIEPIQDVIAGLLKRGHAYSREGHVYFRVGSFGRYGELSRLEREQMIGIAAERGEDPSDPRKEDPLDFPLWKPSGPGEDSWPSPWGVGRPGWHVECSAMALKYLGPQLDVHGGGSDLIYPHHESEVAQSESCTSRSPFARFWVHVEMVRLGGIKMSKSLGNLVLVGDLLPRFGADALRYYLLGTHYREPLDYSEEGLQRSAERAERLCRALEVPCPVVDVALLSDHRRRFDAALADDLDTPAALEALDSFAEAVLRAPGGDGFSATAATLDEMAGRIGLREEPAAAGTGKDSATTDRTGAPEPGDAHAHADRGRVA